MPTPEIPVASDVSDTSTVAKGKRVPERTCAVTRAITPPDEMIRFVAAPDGTVVPDLRRRLPGRGVWVTATRAHVAEAVEKRVFARGLKTAAKADAVLPDEVERLLREAALSALSMARKAGDCASGATKVEGALRSGRVAMLVHACDAAPDGVRKMGQQARRTDAPEPVAVPFDAALLGSALGAESAVHVALLDGGAGRAAIAKLRALMRWDGEDPPGDAGAGDDPPRSNDA